MKKMLSVLLSLVLMSSVIVFPASAANGRFSDVPQGFWAENEINSFANQGIVEGLGDGTFSPASGVTREEFTKMLVLTFKAPLSSPETPTFADVEKGRWSYSYIEVCKDFLTGYANPFGGKASYHPVDFATREDIAVALVKMMELSLSEAGDPNFAAKVFSDAKTVSPQLLPYVSLAAERNLISGYPDGTFGATRGITRAETVALLNRAMKQAVEDINQELYLSTSLTPGYRDVREFTLHVETEAGAKVTVNGQKLELSATSNGKSAGAMEYKFETEGTKTFTIEATKGGKTKVAIETAKYELEAPELIIITCHETVDKPTVTIYGSSYDKKYNAKLTVNGKNLGYGQGDYSFYSYRGEERSLWNETFNLEEGINKFTFVLTNELGKARTVTKTVEYVKTKPVLNITSCPTSVETPMVEIRGTMYDKACGQKLYINEQKVATNNVYDYTKNFAVTVDLKPGENTLKISLINDRNEISTITKNVTYATPAPELKILVCPTAETEPTVEISGTIYDKLAAQTLTVNGAEVCVNNDTNSAKKWSTTQELKEGENTFDFVLTNANGKTVRETRTITYTLQAPPVVQ